MNVKCCPISVIEEVYPKTAKSFFFPIWDWQRFKKYWANTVSNVGNSHSALVRVQIGTIVFEGSFS